MTKVLIYLTMLPAADRQRCLDFVKAEFPQLKVDLASSPVAADPYIDDADILVTFGAHLGLDADRILSRGKSLKWVLALGTGVDHITDVPSLRPQAMVTNMHGMHGVPMTEAAILSMLALAREMPRMLDNQRKHHWERYGSRLLFGKTVGIYGVGAIAEVLGPVCKGFGMNVVGITSGQRKLAGFDRMVGREALAAIVRELDHFVILTPLTDATRNSVDAMVLAAMKPGGFLINLARGGIVDEDALIAVLRDRKIGGAALDVFEQEPLPTDHPFWAMDNVILSPHIGAFNADYVSQVLPLVKENMMRFLAGDIAGIVNVPFAKVVSMPSHLDPPFRADHVGSMIRPQNLLDARKTASAGQLPASELRGIEDRAIRDAVALQERAGLQSITDGEFRRNNWRDRFFERVDGFSGDKMPSSFTFTEFSGETRRGIPVHYATGKLRRREAITASDFVDLAKMTKRTPKATIPSPTVNHFFTGDNGLAKSPYAGDRKSYFADVAAIYRQEIAELGSLGCRYLQVDEVPLAVLCDPRNQSVVAARGENPQALIDDYIDLMNAAIRERPKDMTICVHLCRGNSGHGQASGGYDPVAERLFQKLDFDGFFLEYDTERAGDFAPLRYVPKDKTVVLGLMSTKQKELEPLDVLKRRVADAARFVDMDRLCLSPQCGFASSSEVDRFTVSDEERKLCHLVSAASQIWA